MNQTKLLLKISPGGPGNEDIERLIRAVRVAKDDPVASERYELMIAILNYPHPQFPIKVTDDGQLVFREFPYEREPDRPPSQPLSHEIYDPSEES